MSTTLNSNKPPRLNTSLPYGLLVRRSGEWNIETSYHSREDFIRSAVCFTDSSITDIRVRGAAADIEEVEAFIVPTIISRREALQEARQVEESARAAMKEDRLKWHIARLQSELGAAVRVTTQEDGLNPGFWATVDIAGVSVSEAHGTSSSLSNKRRLQVTLAALIVAASRQQSYETQRALLNMAGLGFGHETWTTNPSWSL